MTVLGIAFATGFIAFQIYLFFLCFHQRILKPVRERRHLLIVKCTAMQVGSVFLILLGSYAEQRWIFFEDLKNNARMLVNGQRLSPAEVYEPKGDPGLIQWVQQQQPDLPRPDLGSAEVLHSWQTDLRRTLLQLFDLTDIALPNKVNYHKLSSITLDQTIVRIFLTFQSFDGTSIPAYLFIPPGSEPLPAVIVLHGHIKYSEGISQTAGIIESYHHGVAFALAEAGYITIAIEFRGFGYLGARLNTEHNLVAYNAILAGSFYKAFLSKDIKYAFDLLQSMEAVDPARIGITGVSFGGEMAVTYAALDERIKVAIFQGYGGSIGGVSGRKGTGKQQPHLCHIIPGFNRHLNQEDIFFLIAPRPLLGVRGDQDDSINPGFSEVIGQAYTILKFPLHFRFEIHHGGHEYFVQPAIEFLKQYL
jgi:dienelactone hydrolase